MYHIACNIDSQYTRYCGVLMVSLFENNRDVPLKMHILGDRLRTSDKQSLMEISRLYGNEIQFYDVDESIFKGFPVSRQWPSVIYYRLLLPQLLDDRIGRILYVDCDIIFRGSVKELMEMDLKGNTIAAVEDILSNYLSYIHLLGYKATEHYFNSGSMLIDVDKWRKDSVSAQCMRYIKEHTVLHPDQDALNAVLHGSWLQVSGRWNFLSYLHVKYINRQTFDMDINKTYPYYPVICHFTGFKPWDSRCRSPFKSEFYEYQSKTVWKDCVPKHSLYEKIHQLLVTICDTLKIRKKNPYYRYD